MRRHDEKLNRLSKKISIMWRIVQVRKPRRALTALVFITVCVFLYVHYEMAVQSPTERFRALYNLCIGRCSQKNYENFDDIGIPRGRVNMDIWKGMCTLSLNSLRQHPFFPSHPQVRSYLEIGDSFKINANRSSFGLRVVGYLHPPVSGYYSFHLHSHFMAQFWLSTSGPENATKLAYTTRNKLDNLVYFVGKPSPKSKRIFLKHGKKHYFEILKVLNNGIENGTSGFETRLDWMLPGQTFFTKIDGRCISNYFNISGNLSQHSQLINSHFNNFSPSLVISDEEDQFVGPLFPPEIRTKPLESKQFNRENVESLPYLARNYSLIAFPKCKYEPSYMKRTEYKRYSGVFNVFYPNIYPDDGSWSVRFARIKDKDDDRWEGAIVMNKSDVDAVAASFMDGLDKAFPGTFDLVDIVHMEHVHDKEKGDRFLLDLVLKRRQDIKLLRVSQLMYRNKSQNELCILHELGWNPKVWINVILNVKNQAEWVMHFIKDVSRVMKKKGDQYINVIIVDYGNKGLDIGQEMQWYGIKNYEVINQTGAFHKTASINLAASRVKDPNSIVLLMDLHLQLSLDFFDQIRKHTFKGILAFAPILFRLDSCGRPRTKNLCPSGFWESLGFGIFSIYKSDWDNFGGMNVQEFTNKWGGEDWEMVDRVLAKGIEIDKLRIPGFYHFYHDKKGMWDT